MSTASPLDTALSNIPSGLRSRLVERYEDLKRAYVNGQYDACGLRAGRFVEIMLRILQREFTGSYTPLGQQLRPIDQEAAALEKLAKSTGPDSMRVIMPRALSFLYTLWNKRGIGHEGGDVDANEIDAATCVRTADWCLSELIRVVHAISLEEAQELLDVIAERECLTYGRRQESSACSTPTSRHASKCWCSYTQNLRPQCPLRISFSWVEYNRIDRFRNVVLAPLHGDRLVEFDRETNTVLLSPRGAAETETKVLPKISVSG